MKKTDKESSRHGMAGDVLQWARRLNNNQKVVLRALADTPCPYDTFNYKGFTHLAKVTMIRRARVRVIVRQLARKGLAAYANGLFNEDGQVAGAGYAVTQLGKVVAQVIGGPANEDDRG